MATYVQIKSAEKYLYTFTLDIILWRLTDLIMHTLIPFLMLLTVDTTYNVFFRISIPFQKTVNHSEEATRVMLYTEVIGK